MSSKKTLRITDKLRPHKATAVRLGDVVTQLLDRHISPRQARFVAVSGLWSQLLPAELQKHCRIVDICSGEVCIAADSPSYMYELRLCSSELLGELQQRCPQARIRKIKVSLA